MDTFQTKEKAETGSRQRFRLHQRFKVRTSAPRVIERIAEKIDVSLGELFCHEIAINQLLIVTSWDPYLK